MKKILFVAALSFAVTGTILTSCQTKEQKVDDAQENVNDAKEDLRDAKADLNSEYPAYKQAAEQKIDMNQKRIDDLREKINTGGKPLDNARAQRIDDLQKQNADLRAKLYGYEQERSDWESFKREFNHDMDELGNALEDLGKDNNK